MIRKSVVFAAFACLIVSATTMAAGDVGSLRNNQPINVKSNELSTDNNKRTATFVGNVSARQGDLTIYAEKLIITYGEDSREVARIEAVGSVRILQGPRQAQAGHAVYENKAGKIILDMSPRVFQGNDVVSGKVIIYYLDEQKSVVTGGPDTRVEAVIHPGNKGKDGGEKP